MEPVRPLPNTYWVVPGRLLAGEYPGDRTAAEAAARLELFFDAGIDCFIDLTEERELEPYEPILKSEAARRGADIRYQRVPIRDFSVPASPEVMRSILDAIDHALEEGRKVYVHCWGGIGRTGTVIGCHLARHGTRGNAALERLRELFGAMEKSARRQSPENAEQERWVREWTD